MSNLPRYAYKCQQCDLRLEANRPVEKRDNPLPCAQCGTLQTVKRVFSVPSFRIEGRAYLYPGGTDWAGEAGISAGDI